MWWHSCMLEAAVYHLVTMYAVYLYWCFVFCLFKRQNMKQNVHNWWKENLVLNIVSVKTYSSTVIQFTQHDISIYTSITGLEALIVVWIPIAGWIRTPYSLVHDYECFGGAFSIYLYRPSKDEDCLSRCKRSVPAN